MFRCPACRGSGRTPRGRPCYRCKGEGEVKSLHPGRPRKQKPESTTMKPCTCQWSTVNTATIDPPDIVRVDPNCPHHGELAHEPDPDEERERQRDDEAFFFGWWSYEGG